MPRRAISDIRVTSISEFVRLFQKAGPLSERMRWFRGETRVKKAGSLLPSIARDPSHVDDEWNIYQRFRQNAAAFLPHARLEPWDWMLYMRHYGVHTRLLDWSESALVALYFAVEKPERDKYGGVVWCLDPIRLNDLGGHEPEIKCAGLDSQLDAFTPESVRAARGTTASFKPVAIIAQRSFARLIAQQGVFTVTHRDQTPLDSINDPDLLVRIKIDRSGKKRIRTTLKALGFNRLSLYPELQSLSEESR